MPTPEELEDQAAEEATAVLRRSLLELRRRATLLADEAVTEDDWKLLATRLAERLETTDTSAITPALAKRTGEAVEMGVADARQRLGLTSGGRRVMAPIDVIRAAMQAPENAAEELREAARLMRTARSADDLDAAFARAQRSVTRTEAAARWSVNRSLSEGVRSVTDEAGAGRLWVPERDACLRCLAYAGLYAGPGEEFPAGLTFGTPVKQLDPVPDPPLHPNCRCRTIPHRVEWGDDYAEALKREAKRSVLRGWSLPSESERARLSAADRLLKRGPGLPKSVQDYARISIKRGSFSRGRAVPSPAPISRPSDARPKVVTPPKPPKDPFADLPRIKQQEYGTDMRAVSRQIMDRIRPVNPKYREHVMWQINCQRATVAYELRARGYDVQALPNRRDVDKQYGLSDILNLFTGRNGRDFDRFGGGRQGGDRARAIAQSWPRGARGFVMVAWKAGGAHVYNVEVDRFGDIHWIDAQTGQDMNEEMDYFRDVDLARMIRVDDLTITEEMVEMVKPRERPTS